MRLWRAKEWSSKSRKFSNFIDYLSAMSPFTLHMKPSMFRGTTTTLEGLQNHPLRGRPRRSVVSHPSTIWPTIVGCSSWTLGLIYNVKALYGYPLTQKSCWNWHSPSYVLKLHSCNIWVLSVDTPLSSLSLSQPFYIAWLNVWERRLSLTQMKIQHTQKIFNWIVSWILQNTP